MSAKEGEKRAIESVNECVLCTQSLPSMGFAQTHIQVHLSTGK